jgi:hypothetical protein
MEMKNKYDINIALDTTTVDHLLGGLAASYRVIPPSAPESVSKNIKYAIIDILTQLELQGVDVTLARSPFHSYTKLVRFKHLP